MKYVFLMIAIIFMATSSQAGSMPKVMNKCKVCHTFEEGGKNKIGPNLFGIIGKQAGTVEEFTRYSVFLTNADFIWDVENMNLWLIDSVAFAKTVNGKKTKMRVKIKKKEQINIIIKYLETLQ